MKNRLYAGLFLLLVMTAAVFGRDYTLDDRADVDVSGIEEIIFELRGVSCALCIRTLDIDSEISGDGSGRDMVLTLTGDITSNREQAVPSLIVEESGRTATVRFYPRRQNFFGLSQSGTAVFTAVVPESWDGMLSVSVSSDDILVRDFDTGRISVASSSGEMDVRRLSGETVDLTVSSGDFRGDALAAINSLVIDSSSGDVSLGAVSGRDITVEASSGDITIGEAAADDGLEVKASSGRIGIGLARADEAVFDTSSGRITIDELQVKDGRIEVSSGDVVLDKATADELFIKLSSGDLEAGSIESEKTEIRTSSDTDIADFRGELVFRGTSGDVSVEFASLEDAVSLDVSSGDITLILPADTAFDAVLDTSSGKIRSEFPIMGDLSADGDEMRGSANGGGPTLDARTSSGDIRLQVR